MTEQETIINKSVESQLREAIALIHAFRDLVEKETRALDRGDFGLVDNLQPLKKDFSRTYQACVLELNAYAPEIAKVPETLRAELIAARTAFTMALTENMESLERMKSSCGRLVERILDGARRTLQQKMPNAPQSYGATGRRTAYSPKKTLSMSLNEQL